MSGGRLAQTGAVLGSVLSILLTGATGATRAAVEALPRIPVVDLWPFVRPGIGTGIWRGATCYEAIQ